MIAIYRLFSRLLEIAAGLPVGLFRLASEWIVFNPRLGPLRHVLTAGLLYVVFALVLVYVMAPIRGIAGSLTLSDKLHYDAERWLATMAVGRGVVATGASGSLME